MVPPYLLVVGAVVPVGQVGSLDEVAIRGDLVDLPAGKVVREREMVAGEELDPVDVRDPCGPVLGVVRPRAALAIWVGIWPVGERHEADHELFGVAQEAFGRLVGGLESRAGS